MDYRPICKDEAIEKVISSVQTLHEQNRGRVRTQSVLGGNERRRITSYHGIHTSFGSQPRLGHNRARHLKCNGILS